MVTPNITSRFRLSRLRFHPFSRGELGAETSNWRRRRKRAEGNDALARAEFSIYRRCVAEAITAIRERKGCGGLGVRRRRRRVEE